MPASRLQPFDRRTPIRYTLTPTGDEPNPATRIIGLQNVFASLGYLKHQNFDGTIGKLTVAAIKTFQKAHGLDETEAFTDDLERQVYAAVANSTTISLFDEQGPKAKRSQGMRFFPSQAFVWHVPDLCPLEL